MRQGSERHSQFHSYNHMSSDLIDHVPSHIPDCSFPARFLLRTTRRSFVPCSLGLAGSKNQLGHFNYHWICAHKRPIGRYVGRRVDWSLMRLVGIYPPPTLCQTEHFRIFLFCSIFNPRATSNANSSQRGFEAGPWSEKPDESTDGVASQSSAWRNHCGTRNTRNLTSTVFAAASMTRYEARTY